MTSSLEFIFCQYISSIIFIYIKILHLPSVVIMAIRIIFLQKVPMSIQATHVTSRLKLCTKHFHH